MESGHFHVFISQKQLGFSFVLWTQRQRAGGGARLRCRAARRACLGRSLSRSHLALWFRWNCGVFSTGQVLWQHLEYVVLQHSDSSFWWVTGVLCSWKRKVWPHNLVFGTLAKSSLQLPNALEFTCRWSKIAWSDKGGLYFLVYILTEKSYASFPFKVYKKYLSLMVHINSQDSV